jgi:hypothetical protein
MPSMRTDTHKVEIINGPHLPLLRCGQEKNPI